MVMARSALLTKSSMNWRPKTESEAAPVRCAIFQFQWVMPPLRSVMATLDPLMSRKFCNSLQ